jgi:hypothetical protein
VDLNKLPELVAETRRLEEEAGRGKTTISAMGLVPVPEFIDVLEENGVERMVLGLSHDNPEEAFEQLNNYANDIAPYLE